MRAFVFRRLLGLVLLVSLSVCCCWLDFSLATSLRPAARVSGISLFALLVMLALFNARKKLPFLPLLKASAWMQFHIYAGWFAMVLFLIHIGFKLPRGALEVTLSILFLCVTFSGLFGLAISRWSPARLTLHGEGLIYERIPALRAGLRREVEELVLGSVAATNSSTIADFYQAKLRAYFERPRYLWSHVLGYSKPLHQLLSELEALDRYLNAEERKTMTQLAELVRAKDNLDFQRAVQGMLKGWLFVHIPLTYALLLFAAVHGIVAWGFT